jgi:hypothetical protein
MAFNRALRFVITGLEDKERTYPYFFVFFWFIREDHRSTKIEFVTAQAGAGYLRLLVIGGGS